MPNFVQAGAYSAVARYLSSLDRIAADKKDPKDGKSAVAAMKQGSWNDSLFGESEIRKDGRVVHDTYLFQVKKPQASSKPWDYYDKVRVVAGRDAALPIEGSACKQQ
jgi:branched-chain amino acid transport system substrate-binding protein